MLVYSIPSPVQIAQCRQAIDFCLYFDTEAGFIAVYEEKLDEKKMTMGLIKGVKMAAYEATEALYCEMLNRGRKFSDYESFRASLSRFKRYASINLAIS